MTEITLNSKVKKIIFNNTERKQYGSTVQQTMIWSLQTFGGIKEDPVTDFQNKKVKLSAWGCKKTDEFKWIPGTRVLGTHFLREDGSGLYYQWNVSTSPTTEDGWAYLTIEKEDTGAELTCDAVVYVNFNKGVPAEEWPEMKTAIPEATPGWNYSKVTFFMNAYDCVKVENEIKALFFQDKSTMSEPVQVWPATYHLERKEYRTYWGDQDRAWTEPFGTSDDSKVIGIEEWGTAQYGGKNFQRKRGVSFTFDWTNRTCTRTQPVAGSGANPTNTWIVGYVVYQVRD